jgi:hypothetical protein
MLVLVKIRINEKHTAIKTILINVLPNGYNKYAIKKHDTEKMYP